MRRSLTVLLLCILLVLPLVYGEESAKKAPGFSLKDINKREVVLDSLLGKGPIVIDFWATWCKPCLVELDHIRDIYKELKEKGLTVVAINEDDPRSVSKVKPLTASRRWEFHILMDPNKQVKRLYQVVAYPTTFVLDAEGNIKNKHIGYTQGSEVELKKEIEKLLPPAQSEPDTTAKEEEETQ